MNAESRYAQPVPAHKPECVRGKFDLGVVNGESLYVDYQEYEDGCGPTLDLYRKLDQEALSLLWDDELAETRGVNERLYEYERTRQLVLESQTGTRLSYERGGNFSPFLSIYGDLARKHYPQTWAKGFLPIISIKRATFFARHPSRILLQYRVPDYVVDQVNLATHYYHLLLIGWSTGGFLPVAKTKYEFLELLLLQGFDRLVAEDIDLIRSSLSSYHVNLSRTLGAGVEGVIKTLTEISEAFEKYAIVPSAPLPSSPHNIYIED